MAVNVFEDFKNVLRIGNVVTDYHPTSVSRKTFFRSRVGNWSRVAISWHSHPAYDDTGRSWRDAATAKELRTSYRSFSNTRFIVTYRVGGEVESECYSCP